MTGPQVWVRAVCVVDARLLLVREGAGWQVPGRPLASGEDPRQVCLEVVRDACEVPGRLVEPIEAVVDGDRLELLVGVVVDRPTGGDWSALDSLPQPHSPAARRAATWGRDLEPIRLAGVVLTDPEGRLLLQERDDQTPNSPNLWGLVGGAVDPGECFDEAAVRELEEETGVTGVRLELVLDRVVTTRRRPQHWRIYTARTELTDADITCGEGRQIVFVDRDAVGRLPLFDEARSFLGELFDI